MEKSVKAQCHSSLKQKMFRPQNKFKETVKEWLIPML